MSLSRGERRRRPTIPGSYVKRGLVEDRGLTQTALAEALGVSRRSVNQLINGRRALTAEMALRLGRLTDTSPEMWLNLQRAVDLWDAEQALREEIARIEPLPQSDEAA